MIFVLQGTSIHFGLVPIAPFFLKYHHLTLRPGLKLFKAVIEKTQKPDPVASPSSGSGTATRMFRGAATRGTDNKDKDGKGKGKEEPQKVHKRNFYATEKVTNFTKFPRTVFFCIFRRLIPSFFH
jgi:hypothetical protein